MDAGRACGAGLIRPSDRADAPALPVAVGSALGPRCAVWDTSDQGRVCVGGRVCNAASAGRHAAHTAYACPRVRALLAAGSAHIVVSTIRLSLSIGRVALGGGMDQYKHLFYSVPERQ